MPQDRECAGVTHGIRSYRPWYHNKLHFTAHTKAIVVQLAALSSSCYVQTTYVWNATIERNT